MAKLDKKCRQCRRERQKLFLKGARCYSPNCPIEKKGGVPPGDHGLRSGVRPSEYAKQLREKQKIKRIFGVSEEKFKQYYDQAEEEKGNTAELLLTFLERRLDNVVARLNFAPSRTTARQLITHGHVLVNGKTVTIPSYQVEIDDVISLKEKAQEIPHINTWVEEHKEAPEWLVRKEFQGKVKRLPKREEMITGVEESLVVEYYSR
jgi:small subunit ribosomal protein S4